MHDMPVRDMNDRHVVDSVLSIVTRKSCDDDFGSCNDCHKEDVDLAAGPPSPIAVEENAIMATPPSDTTVENSLSKGLLMLSITDRNAVEEEIHGVRCLGVTKETPDLLHRSLQEFDRELLSIKNSSSRIATIQNVKSSYHKRKHPSKSINQGDPMDVLKNVIDSTQDNLTTISTSQQQCYLNDPDVRLRFLRCESFDAKAAAIRFVNFFDLAQEVFGNFVADRAIRLSDFFEAPGGGRPRRYQQHEKKALSHSSVQYLPFRDRSGRRVKVGVGEVNADLDLVLRIKINLILDWIASEDVETQQKGIVIIAWPSDPPTSNISSTNSSSGSSIGGGTSSCSSEDETSTSSNWEEFLRPKYTKNDIAYHKRYYRSQPIRVAAMHWCSQDKPIYRVLNSLYYFSLDSKSQSRYKVHLGEPLEIRYKLQAFGIPIDLLPLTHTLALKRQHHMQWMTCRRYIELQEKKQKQEQQQQQHHQQYQQFEHNQLQQQQHFQQQFQQDFLRQRALQRALQFFESVAAIDSTSASLKAASKNGESVVVECPRSYDVIIGKAKVCTNNPGNGFYSSLIEATHDEHDSLVHARDKVAMTWRILLYITEEKKGRFLDWNKSLNAWVVIQDRVVIRKKIANSYKEYKRSRYVTARSSTNLKKNKPPSDGANIGSNGNNNNTVGNNSALSTKRPKRRKITGCLGNDDITINKDIESMFIAM